MDLQEKDINQLNAFERFLSWEMTPIFKKFVNCNHKIIGLFTGNQCLLGSSEIYDPVIMKATRIDEIKDDFHVYAWDGEKKVIAKAERPFRKEIDDMYEFTLSNGDSFTASMGHHVLTPSGWQSMSELRQGSAVCLPQSISGNAPLIPSLDDRHWKQKAQDSQGDCQISHHLCDAPLHSEEGSGQDASPLQADALQHKELRSLHKDGLLNKYKHTHNSQSGHLSNQDAQNHLLALYAVTLYRAFYKGQKRIFGQSQVDRQLPNVSGLQLQQALLFYQWATQILSYVVNRLCLLHLLKHSTQMLPTFLFSFLEQSKPLFGQVEDQFSSALVEPPVDVVLVSSITYKGKDYKWDFTVPKYHNYLHAGVIHHNSMKTSSTAYQYVLRILGWHPVPEKNVLYFVCKSRYCKNGHRITDIPKDWKCLECGEEISKFNGHKYSIKTRPGDNVCTQCDERLEIYDRKSRIFRFASATLPNEKGSTGDGGQSAETKNTQYPEFKKWLPAFLIKKDITARNFNMRIMDPNAGTVFGDLAYKGHDIIVEFVSYHQGASGTAGVQRMSIWEDEEADQAFHEEQVPRLLADNGDLIITLTPANFITWTYDEVFEKAKVYYRSKLICDYLSSQEGGQAKQVEHTDSVHNIAVIQAATDDNPTLSGDVINEMFSSVDDPDTLAIRRYGIFKQVSGRIFKDFEYSTHFIDGDKYFPDGIPHGWVHARGIDYHSQTPWGCVMASLSPTNEMFVWNEFNPSPEKMTTREISRELALMGKDYKFTLNLIDPFAKATSKDNVTVLDDINREFHELKMNNIGAGGYWQPWDTKGEKGRDAVRERLKGSKEVGKPFNNVVIRNGVKTYLPTLWIFNSCKIVGQSMKQWRNEEWADSRSRSQKDAKNKPMQKWSHMCMAVEAILKESAFRAGKNYTPNHRNYGYFQNRGR